MIAGEGIPSEQEPRSSRSSRLRFTREGFIWLISALLVGAAVWFKNFNLLVFLAYLMLALLILNGFLARLQAGRVTARREPLPPVHAGEEVLLRVRAANRGRGAATVVVEQRGDIEARWLVERLPAGSEIECTARHTFHLRGRFGQAPPVVASDYPLGLLRHEHSGEPAEPIVVLPALGEVDAQALRRWLVQQTGGEGRTRSTRPRDTKDPVDVRGIRPYRPGDSIQWIHWKSSARRGQLMVREFDTAPSPDLLLVVEPWLPESPTELQRERLEAALSMAASIFRAWCTSLDTKATMVLAGSSMALMSGPPTATFARAALVPLADAVGEDPVRVPEPTAIGAALRRSARLVISSRPRTSFANALMRATGKPFVALDPTANPEWYKPPVPGRRVGRLSPLLPAWYSDLHGN